jgi:aryl-alcohol dehydrogenase-like predicted oxidoreductase
VTGQSVAQASGTFTIGGDLTVNRLGFGAMRLTGQGVWGPPDDRDECVRVLRRAVELGVNFIDTENSYGPYVSEELIREALHPYDGVVIATKAGLLRTGPGEWTVLGYPAYLRQECEMNLSRLGVDAIDLFQLHRIDDKFPAEDQIGDLSSLPIPGTSKVAHLEENVAAAAIELSDEEFETLSKAGSAGG